MITFRWWGLPPMAIFTFLESYDYSGKKIVPFCSHEGSGFGSGLRDLKAAIPAPPMLTRYLKRTIGKTPTEYRMG